MLEKKTENRIIHVINGKTYSIWSLAHTFTCRFSFIRDTFIVHGAYFGIWPCNTFVCTHFAIAVHSWMLYRPDWTLVALLKYDSVLSISGSQRAQNEKLIQTILHIFLWTVFENEFFNWICIIKNVKLFVEYQFRIGLMHRLSSNVHTIDDWHTIVCVVCVTWVKWRCLECVYATEKLWGLTFHNSSIFIH